MRCYAPSTSAIAVMFLAGYLALRHVAGHVLAPSLAITIVIGLGVAGVATGAIVVSAATVRRRRAAAGACHTCVHPCAERTYPDAPQWPHQPLTRNSLPVVVIPRQRPAEGAGQPVRVTASRAGTADR